MADQNEPVHFFDIACSLEGPRQSWSPNTLKTRAVLNYKGIKYTQSFISYPDIAPVSKGLGIAPYTDEYTAYMLPAITHKASIHSNPHGALPDSFPIALHLEKTFPAPQYPSIFPNGQASITLVAATEKFLSLAIAKFATIVLPGVAAMLDDRGKQYFEETRVPRFQKRYPHIQKMADMGPKTKEEYDTVVADTKKELQVFEALLEGKGLNKGPFLEGDKPGYADLVLAAHLAWFERPCPEAFETLLGDENSLLRKHWEASQSFLNGQGETKIWAVPKM